jgi:hypothetical protein
VARDDVDVRVDDGDEGLAHVGVGDARRLEARAVGRALEAPLDRVGAHQRRSPPASPDDPSPITIAITT